MTLPRIAYPGIPYILSSFAAALLVSAWNGFFAVPFWILAVFVTNFFRDPKRVSVESQDAVLSPADGRIIDISRSELPEPYHRHNKISIFMNIFNVHVNRMPLDGTIKESRHYPGEYLAANHPESSFRNERQEIHIAAAPGPVMVRLVAGLVARRIVPWITDGDVINRGERIGMIKFGSRVDIYIPSGMRIEVGMGDRVKAGFTRIATISRETAV